MFVALLEFSCKCNVTSILELGGNNIMFPLISACVESNVSRLVYTSTYNVVYGGEEIVNGEESLPYLPMDKVRTSPLSDQTINTG